MAYVIHFHIKNPTCIASVQDPRVGAEMKSPNISTLFLAPSSIFGAMVQNLPLGCYRIYKGRPYNLRELWPPLGYLDNHRPFPRTERRVHPIAHQVLYRLML